METCWYKAQMPTGRQKQIFKEIFTKNAAKAPSGPRCLKLQNKMELEYLYCTGFVDEMRHEYTDWLNAFENSLQDDGSYVVTEDQWMDKVHFLYDGPMTLPYDALTIPDRPFGEAEMQVILNDKILPSLCITKEQFAKVFEEAKEDFYKNGQYAFTPETKQNLNDFMNLFPSPRRVRELGFQESLAAHKSAGQATGTGFQQGASQGQQAAQRLMQLLSKK